MFCFTQLIDVSELVLDAHDELKPIRRIPGRNDVGMVAWLITLATPGIQHLRRQ